MIKRLEEIEKTLAYQTKLLETLVTSFDENRHMAEKNKKMAGAYMEIAEKIFSNANSPALKPFRDIMEKMR